MSKKMFVDRVAEYVDAETGRKSAYLVVKDVASAADNSDFRVASDATMTGTIWLNIDATTAGAKYPVGTEIPAKAAVWGEAVDHPTWENLYKVEPVVSKPVTKKK